MTEYFEKYNENPENKSVGDCTIRAISAALDQTWEKTYTGKDTSSNTENTVAAETNSTSDYVNREEFEALKAEIEALKSSKNQGKPRRITQNDK